MTNSLLPPTNTLLAPMPKGTSHVVRWLTTSYTYSTCVAGDFILSRAGGAQAHPSTDVRQVSEPTCTQSLAN